MNRTVLQVTERIAKRSQSVRAAYLDAMHQARDNKHSAQGAGGARAHLSCGNQAHAYAAAGKDKGRLAKGRTANIGIITAYNDMLSAHQPFASYPDIIKTAARAAGGTAQVAGGVPAMCDGITQGQTGMELSLFSRDVIALATAVALSHNVFDAVLYLGVCDKIVPGLVIAAARFGHLPGVFVPAGPMPSGLDNASKAKVREQFAKGDADRNALMRAEMASYHAPGTCTFYGTANSNQMLMEFMGLHIPGAAFVNPNTPLRTALTIAATKCALANSDTGEHYCPLYNVLCAKAFVNGIVGLMATGGSTNLILHLPVMARAAGIIITLEDFAALSDVVPLLARVYPNGLADVNHFHAAGGLPLVMQELVHAELLHVDAPTIYGHGIADYMREPKLNAQGDLLWQAGAQKSHNDKIIAPYKNPFQRTGGIKHMRGNLGQGILKVSALANEHMVISAPARIFNTQHDVVAACKQGAITTDTVIVVRFQGVKANGMPELHALTPALSILQGRGLNVALLTDGRMSGASGKVPAVIHITPETIEQGAIAQLQNGDMITINGHTGELSTTADLTNRPHATHNPNQVHVGLGRELFNVLRQNANSLTGGCSLL